MSRMAELTIDIEDIYNRKLLIINKVLVLDNSTN
jgi:hypothetical protein